MAELLRSRQHLPGPESLHLAHIMTELLREWVVGGAPKFGDRSALWRQSQLQSVGETRVKLNFAARLEFQDGKRRQASQAYHGRGAVHLHALIFAEDAGPLRLREKLSATVPCEGHPLRGYVLDQLSYTGSGWPTHDGPSCWDAASGAVKLHHTEFDAEQGVRAYNETELEVLRCHVDNLAPQADAVSGRGLLLRYVAAYAPKMNDNFCEELLAETSGGGYGAALRVLSSYRPSEPEMWLNLFGKKFPQFALGGSMTPIVAPWPGMEPMPNFVEQHKMSVWRGEDMRLLEFLRKSNAKGEIVEWLRKSHAGDSKVAERLEQQIAEENSPLCCMGEPGTGKTFVADYLIRWAVAKGLRVLYALPTGQLACRMRQRHPTIEVDTCAGAFLFHRPVAEAIAVLMDYDVVVIDEVLQLSAAEFGRLDEMFLAANKQLLLLMMGDDWQLPSIHPVRADEHPQWRFLQVVTLTEVRRCTDPELAFKLQALRRSKPMSRPAVSGARRRAWRPPVRRARAWSHCRGAQATGLLYTQLPELKWPRVISPSFITP